MKKYLGVIGLLLLVVLILPSVVMGAYDYYITITVYNNDSSAVTGLPVIVEINNSQLADLGYILSSGLDTSVTEGASGRQYSVVDNKTILIIPSLQGYQQKTFNYRLGESTSQAYFNFSTGDGGNVTIADGRRRYGRHEEYPHHRRPRQSQRGSGASGIISSRR